MQAEVRTGPVVVADGAITPARGAKTGEIIVADAHGRYYEGAVRGNVFQAANQAVATTTVGLALTYTGLILSNPIASTVNLVLLKATMMQSVIQAAQIEAFALAYGYSPSTNVTHTTPAAIQPTRIGSGATGQGKADISGAMPVAPLYGTFISQTGTATSQPTQSTIDLEGSVILIPGAYAAWVTPAQASVAGMWFSFMWEEVAI